MELETRD